MRKLFLSLLLLASITSFAQSTMQTANMQHAMAAFKEGDSESALQYLADETEVNPTNGFAYAIIASVLEEQGYKPAMLKYATEAIKYLPKSEAALVASLAIACGEVYNEGGDSVRAISFYNRALEADKKNAKTYLSRAGFYYGHKDYQHMLQDAQTAAKLDAGQPRAFLLMAKANYELKNYEQAIADAEKGASESTAKALLQALAGAAKKGGQNNTINLNFDKGVTATFVAIQAQSLCALKRYDEALTKAIRSLRTDLTGEAVEACYTLGDSTDAVALMDSLTALAVELPGKFWVHGIMGDVYNHRNDHVNAALCYHRSIRIEDRSVAYRQLGNIYQNHLGNPEKAEQMFRLALEKDSADTGNLLHLGDLYHDLGRNTEALEMLNKAIAMGGADKDSYVYYLRARVYRDMHDFQNAETDLLRQLVAHPDNAHHAFSVGEHYMQQGDTLHAEQMFAIGKQILNGQEPEPEDYIAMGEMDKAIQAADHMVKDERSSSEHYNAACVYAQAGAEDKAMQELEEAFRLGFRNFYHIVWDDDLNNIRTLPDFNELVMRYKALTEEENERLEALLAADAE